MKAVAITKVLSRRVYRAGYEVRKELCDGKEFSDGKSFEMTSAYNPKGDYIGDPRFAHHLCVQRGIIPEKSSPGHSVCSIGYCPQKRKWYGWSHRAILGFGVGSKIKKGDCRDRLPIGFECKTLADCRRRAIDSARSVS